MIGEGTKEILEKVRELLTPHGRWTKGTFAKDAEGKSESPLSSNAVCWCLSGGLTKIVVEGDYNSSASDEVRRLLHKIMGDNSLPWWNDYVARSQDDVIKMLDRAIKECQP